MLVKRSRAVPWLVLGAYAVALWASAPAWPDDWDGVGFVESVTDFDLARFRPHPPGYPAYVALLRLAAFFVRDPMRACVVVSVLSGAVAMLLVWDASRRMAGRWAAWALVTWVGVLPMVWRTCSGVGSEAPALACTAACAWGLAVRRTTDEAAETAATGFRWAQALALGLGVGLGLGVRISWAPVYVAALLLAPREWRARVWGLGVCRVRRCGRCRSPPSSVRRSSWRFARSTSRVTRNDVEEPSRPSRVVGAWYWLLRDILVDGLGAGTDFLGLAIGALTFASIVAALAAWGAAGWRARGQMALVVGPYLVWIFLGQNLRDQPRHVLPILVLLAAALAFRASRSPRAFGILCSLALLVAMRTTRDALDRKRIPPTGEQLVALVREQPKKERIAVFGVRSTRFFELTELAGTAFTANALGDVQLQLSRSSQLPSRVWVTSEVERTGDPRWPLSRVATLCRPSRLGRVAPCIDVDEWKVPYLPSP